MNKFLQKTAAFAAAGLILSGAAGCGPASFETDGEQTAVSFRIENCKSSDAKFYGEDIVTGIDRQLVFLDKDGNEKRRYPELATEWLYVLPEEKAVVFSACPEGIGVARFDEEKNLVSVSMLLTEVMLIDPTIVKAGSAYYLTATGIEGTVNAPDLNLPNGEYTIHLYRSDNLQDWTRVGAVARAKKDLEDVRVLYQDGRLIYVYERESAERGVSQVELVYSEDGGETFVGPFVLLTPDSDHEIAGFHKTDTGYRLYYSCDLLYPGESYQGSLPFYADFDENWHLVKRNVRIPTESEKGLLLYDVRTDEETEYYLCAGSYLTDNDLLMETRQKKGK